MSSVLYWWNVRRCGRSEVNARGSVYQCGPGVALCFYREAAQALNIYLQFGEGKEGVPERRGGGGGVIRTLNSDAL